MRHAKEYELAREAGKVLVGIEPPELMPGLRIWFDDFFELSSDRQLGMVTGPIPASTIDRYVADMDWEDADMARACLRAMDAAYIKEINRKPGDADDVPQKAGENAARDQFRAFFAGHKGRHKPARDNGPVYDAAGRRLR